MNELYETKISDKRWMAYDVPGNIGWILWLYGTYRILKQGTGMYPLLNLIPAILMITGVIELIAERFQKLDRVLTKMRLYRGFGALTLGGILGIPVSLIGIIQKGYGTLPAVMLAGAVLCALFAYLLFVSYRKKTS